MSNGQTKGIALVFFVFSGMRGAMKLNLKLYSVYRKGDIPIIIARTAGECAKAMGISEGSFRTLCSKQTSGKLKPGKFEIFCDDYISEEELAR